ncbi:MAG: hypothetical protein R2748_12760 [Bryobacterales bacterium]
MHRNCLFLSLAALLAVSPAAHAGKVSGAIFTTTANGDTVNENHYPSKCAVYLNGGPGPNAPAKAAGLPDGDYYFQVTDPSGHTLLSTDPVSNRRFQVMGGVIIAYTGVGGPVHPTGISQDHPELGSITIQLANTTCPTDYLDTPNDGGVYKVWATPVGDFDGDPTLVDNDCGGGCFHGFRPSKSKTDNFKVEPSTPTFCLTVVKELPVGPDDSFLPVPDWQMSVLDPLGVTNTYFTQQNADGSVNLTLCGLTSGSYTVTEDLPFGFEIFGLFVNGMEIPADTTYSFTWDPTKPPPIIVFRNIFGGILGYLDLGEPAV